MEKKEKQKEHSTPVVSDVDSCGEKDRLWKVWGKWERCLFCFFFSSVLLLQTADIKNRKKNEINKKLVWLVWKDCQMSSGYQTADMFSFKKIPAEGRSLTFQRVSGSHSSHHVRHCTQAEALLFTRLTLLPLIQIWSCWHTFSAAEADGSVRNTYFQGVIDFQAQN